MTNAQVNRLRDKALVRRDIFLNARRDLRAIEDEILDMQGGLLIWFDDAFAYRDETLGEIFDGCDEAIRGIMRMRHALYELRRIEAKKLDRLDKIAARAEQIRKGA